VSHIRNLIRELKAVAHMHTVALLLDADLDFAQPTTSSTHQEKTK
jgi:hypothetical protein